jgi:2-C-methyl-D-erythritol 4-phosphate cytidylyltransferase
MQRDPTPAPGPTSGDPASATVWTIVVAGGRGRRFGSAKQLAVLGGQRVLDRSVAAARAVSDGVVVVTTADQVPFEISSGADLVVAGGSSRSASVRNGLDAVPVDAAVIVVHDAARPLTPVAAFRRVIEAVRHGAVAAITAIPVVDTLKRVEDSIVVETIDRSTLVAVQTPQAFRSSVLRAAHESGRDATDDAGLVETLGYPVQVVEGDVRSRKLTTVEDLAILEAFLLSETRPAEIRSAEIRSAEIQPADAQPSDMPISRPEQSGTP